MDSQKLDMAALFSKECLQSGLSGLFVHLGKQIGGGFGHGAAESFDGLVGNIRIKIQDAGFQMSWLVGLRSDRNPCRFRVSFSVGGKSDNLFTLHVFSPFFAGCIVVWEPSADGDNALPFVPLS